MDRIVSWWVGVSVGWLVNGPIGFWFGVSVNWWDVGSVELSVGWSLRGRWQFGWSVDWSFGHVVGYFNLSVCRHGFRSLVGLVGLLVGWSEGASVGCLTSIVCS
jgi:hypothetical protein